MKVKINPPKETKIQTKYIVTIDKSLKDEIGNTVNLKKGDLLQGINIYTSGDISNDSGTQSLVFMNKQGNRFNVQIGFRGFEPFYEEYKGEATTNTGSVISKYTFVKDYNYTSWGIAPIPHTIKSGESFDGIETANGIVISLNGSNPSDYSKEVLSPDMPSSFLTVPKEYLKEVAPESFLQKHKTHLLIAGALVIGYFAYKKFNK